MIDDRRAFEGSAGAADNTTPENQALSPAVVRFRSCRWRRGPEEGGVEHCCHRDVLPMAGTTGFDPEAWCPDCAFYKARRVPRKKPADQYHY